MTWISTKLGWLGFSALSLKSQPSILSIINSVLLHVLSNSPRAPVISLPSHSLSYASDTLFSTLSLKKLKSPDPYTCLSGDLLWTYLNLPESFSSYVCIASSSLPDSSLTHSVNVSLVATCYTRHWPWYWTELWILEIPSLFFCSLYSPSAELFNLFQSPLHCNWKQPSFICLPLVKFLPFLEGTL